MTPCLRAGNLWRLFGPCRLGRWKDIDRVAVFTGARIGHAHVAVLLGVAQPRPEPKATNQTSSAGLPALRRR